MLDFICTSTGLIFKPLKIKKKKFKNINTLTLHKNVYVNVSTTIQFTNLYDIVTFVSAKLGFCTITKAGDIITIF